MFPARAFELCFRTISQISTQREHCHLFDYPVCLFFSSVPSSPPANVPLPPDKMTSSPLAGSVSAAHDAPRVITSGVAYSSRGKEGSARDAGNALLSVSVQRSQSERVRKRLRRRSVADSEGGKQNYKTGTSAFSLPKRLHTPGNAAALAKSRYMLSSFERPAIFLSFA